MTETALERLYTLLCETLTAEGEANTQAYLARFALLAMQAIDDEATIADLIARARRESRAPQG